MTRREAREHVFRMLFLQNFHLPEERKEQMELYFEYWDTAQGLEQADTAELDGRLESVTARLPELDQVIREVSVGWTPERMSRIDLSIVRLAAYEILMDEEIPTGVAINEAVELAKKFGGDHSPSFVNGILAKIATR